VVFVLPPEEVRYSVKVVVKDPEEFESALREFRRKVQEQGLVREVRRRAHYLPPAEARKIKSIRARRRRR
jgi:small subunit ribosomal protein S21